MKPGVQQPPPPIGFGEPREQTERTEKNSEELCFLLFTFKNDWKAIFPFDTK
jgi:hypothetical protein